MRFFEFGEQRAKIVVESARTRKAASLRWSMSLPIRIPFTARLTCWQIVWVTNSLSPVIILISTPIEFKSEIILATPFLAGSKKETNPKSSRFCSSSLL